MNRIIILASLLIATVGEAKEHKVVEVLIDKRVEVSGSTVLLGDIAQIRGDDASVRGIASLQLGRSPSPGNYRILKRKRVKAFLARNGWEGAIVSAPERIKVWRSWRPLSPDELVSEVKRVILEKMPWPTDMVEVEVLPPNGEVVLPEGKVALKVELPARFDFLGREPARVSVIVDGKDVKNLWVRTDIRVYTDVVTVSRPVLRNEILREGDLKVEKRLLTSLPRGIFNDASEIVGMRAKRTIRKGAVIFEGDLALPPIIKRGGMVTIVAEKGPLAISTTGKAMEKGYMGKVIRVENVSSKKVVLAEVVDQRTVRINF